jgi:hypothetical protein
LRLATIKPDNTGQTELTPGNPSIQVRYPSWGGLPPANPDTDHDGSSNAIENAGPHGGDANNDGIADSTQPNVTSSVNAVTGAYVVVVSSFTSVDNASVSPESTTYNDVAFNYPAGLVSFTTSGGTPGSTATISVYYYDIVADSLAVRKYNPTTHTYQAVPGVSTSQLTIGDRTVAKATYQVTDGSSLDLDGAANGSIVDPVGLGQSVIGAPNTGLGGVRLPLGL